MKGSPRKSLFRDLVLRRVRTRTWIDFSVEIVAVSSAPYGPTKSFSGTVPVTVEIDGREQLVVDVVERLAEVIDPWDVADPRPSLGVGDRQVDVLSRWEWDTEALLPFDSVFDLVQGPRQGEQVTHCLARFHVAHAQVVAEGVGRRRVGDHVEDERGDILGRGVAAGLEPER